MQAANVSKTNTHAILYYIYIFQFQIFALSISHFSTIWDTLTCFQPIRMQKLLYAHLRNNLHMYSILYADKTFQRNMPGKWLSKEHTCLLITSPHTSVLPFHNTVKKTQWSLCWTPVNRWRKNINQEHLRVQQFNQSIINNLYSYTIRNIQRNAGGVVSSI